MAENTVHSYNDCIIHPGETILDVLKDRGISLTELAERTNLPITFMRDVVEGEEDITETFAVALEKVFGVPKSFWLHLQHNYNNELLEQNKKKTRIIKNE